MMTFRAFPLYMLVLTILAGSPTCSAAEPTLVVSHGGIEQRFTTTELLARPDARLLTVHPDFSSDEATYRAVPLLPLLGDVDDARFDTLEARATDGFVSQIPLALIASGASGGAVAWIAVEDPNHPWALLPHKTLTPGPFYLVWEHPERSGVRSEQWPYQLANLTFADSPVRRWPQLAVPPSLPANALARRGQAVFLVQCLPCHRLNGGGSGEVGPDLGRPMSPTQYLTDAGLRAIIRNTRAVRTWPGQQMEVFDKAILPDTDLDAVVAYLYAMAGTTLGPAATR
jgi:mono/diheme cytochrome c family protein